MEQVSLWRGLVEFTPIQNHGEPFAFFEHHTAHNLDHQRYDTYTIGSRGIRASREILWSCPMKEPCYSSHDARIALDGAVSNAPWLA